MRGYPGALGVRRAVLAMVALFVAAPLLHPGPVRAVDSAAGGLPPELVVSENPVGWTPHVLDGRVLAIARVGDRMVVGGTFSQVRQAGTKEVLQRKNLFAFDAGTGVIDRSFVPDPDGKVSALVTAPGGGAVFVGGTFRHITGQAQWALAKLDVPSGRLSGGFRTSVDWRVDDLVVNGSRLFVAGVVNRVNGVERSGLAAVDAASGDLDPGVDVRFTDPRNELLVVNRIAVRRDGSKLVALGSFRKADGQDRPQIAVVDLAGGAARLADWHTDGYADPCGPEFDTYMRGVDISADGAWFVVVTAGGRARPLCDAVARFEFNKTGRNIKPSWVDFSGGDTFTGVAVTDAAVYVGGHQRWMNNPFHNDTGITTTPGVGSVPRPGISALDPANGLPLTWNPGRDPRGLGVFTFVATPEGLWIGSDTDNVGGEYHPRLALLPTEGGTALRKPAALSLPTVLYRRPSGATEGAGPGLVTQTLDASGVGPVRSLGGALDWSQARAAFPADGRLYIAWADGRIESRPSDGAGLGAPKPLDLGGLAEYPPAKFPVGQLTGTAFDPERGRLYFTIEGDPLLYYRYFTPQSGVVGGLPFIAGGPGTRQDWSNVGGLAIASGYLYVARTDGRIQRFAPTGGDPAWSNPTVVSSLPAAGTPAAGTPAAGTPAGEAPHDAGVDRHDH